MSKNISSFIRKQNIKNIIDKIITKTFDVILYPLRFAYSKYDGSDLQSKRTVKKAYKKIKNDIYKRLLSEDYIYITDFYVGNDEYYYEIFSINRESYTITYHTKKTEKEIFNEIKDMLMSDECVLVENVGVRDIFKYGYYSEEKSGRVLKVSVLYDKEDKQ